MLGGSHEVPATMGQRLIWALDRMRGESGALNCPALCTIKGPLRCDQLERALATLQARHAALRTRILPGRRITLSVHDVLPAPLALYDFSETTDSEQRLHEFVRRELARRIDPTCSPLRLSLLTLSPREHVLVINTHHIVTDLVSSEVLVEDLAAALAGCGSAPPSNAAVWNIEDVNCWENDRISSGKLAAQQRYWHQRLAGMIPIVSPLRPGRADARGSTGLLERRIDRAARERLDAIAAANRTSAFAVLLAVLYSQAYLASGERDLAVGSLFSTRSRPELSRTVAFLVNLLMLRVRIPPRPTFIDLVDQCHLAIRGAMDNADVPFHALAPPPPGVNARPNARPDDVVFHVVPRSIEATYAAGDLELSSRVPEVVGRFDLEWAIRPDGDNYVVRLIYNEERLGSADAERLISAYVAHAAAVSHNPAALLT